MKFFNFTKKNEIENPQTVYVVRIVHRRKIARSYTEELEFKAFDSREKSVNYLEAKGLIKEEKSSYKEEWRKIVKKDIDVIQGWVLELEVK
tara:strand:- start:42273 stop:42545 length:273 start_codon:yes stop_codon:yes gene_type:complete